MFTDRESPQRRSQKRFATGLRQAIHDYDHEQELCNDEAQRTRASASHRQVVHFWDTDCLFWPALGFRADEASADTRRNLHSRQSSSDRVVQALFSSGFLGRVALAGPHRNEFAALLSGYLHRQATGEGQQQSLRGFVARHDLEHLMSSLAAAASEAQSAPSEESLRGAVDELRRVDKDTFPLVEALCGTWATRVYRLISDEGLVLADVAMPSLSEILRSALFGKFSRALAEERQQKDASLDRSAQTAVDAAALCAVAILNASVGVFPRFYTSSDSIRRVFKKHAWARDAFSFEFTTRRGTAVQDTVLRGSYYYFLRATIPALQRNGALVAPVGGGPGLQELRDLSRTLNEALDSGGNDLQALAAGWTFMDGTTASSLIAELEASAMGLVWLRFPVDPIARDAISGVKAVYELASLKESKLIAEGLLADAEKNLRVNMSDLALQVSLTKAVQARTKCIVSGGESRIEVERALSIAMWGVKSVGLIEIEPGRDALSSLFSISSIQDLRADQEKAELAVSGAMGLELFSLAERLVRALSAQSGSVTEATWIMGEVAKIREASFSVDLAQTCDVILSRWGRLSRDEQSRLCLAYAEAAFRLWERGGFAGYGIGPESSRLVVERWPADPLGIATWGLERVHECLSSFHWPGRVLALDHIYRTVKVLDLPAARFSSELKEVEAAPQDNGYRRLAILGYAQYLDALRNYPESGRQTDEAYEMWRRDFLPRLSGGVEVLRSAQELAPYNPDVRDYLRSAEQLLKRESNSASSMREATNSRTRSGTGATRDGVASA